MAVKALPLLGQAGAAFLFVEIVTLNTPFDRVIVIRIFNLLSIGMFESETPFEK